MIVKLDLRPSEFAALAVWLDSNENGWRKYFLVEPDQKCFQPKLVRLLKSRENGANSHDVELEIPHFLAATDKGDFLEMAYYNHQDRGRRLKQTDGKLPRHLTTTIGSVTLVDPTPIVDCMFAAIVAGRT